MTRTFAFAAGCEIGLTFEAGTDGRWFVEHVEGGSAAAEQSVPRGAELYAVNDQPTRGLSMSQVSAMIRAVKGTRQLMMVVHTLYSSVAAIEAERRLKVESTLRLGRILAGKPTAGRHGEFDTSVLAEYQGKCLVLFTPFMINAGRQLVEWHELRTMLMNAGMKEGKGMVCIDGGAPGMMPARTALWALSGEQSYPPRSSSTTSGAGSLSVASSASAGCSTPAHSSTNLALSSAELPSH
jgi:hypothetical protein